MTVDQLAAMEQQAGAKIQQTKDALLRLEGYRLCLNDLIKAVALEEAKAKTDAAAKVDPPAVPLTPPVEN